MSTEKGIFRYVIRYYNNSGYMNIAKIRLVFGAAGKRQIVPVKNDAVKISSGSTDGLVVELLTAVRTFSHMLVISRVQQFKKAGRQDTGRQGK